MFTALVVTRGALYAFYALGLQSPKLYGSKTTKKVYNVLKIRKAVFAISVLILLAGGAGMGINNSKTGHLFHYSMDFTGGTSTSVTFNEEMSLEDISSKVVPVVEKVTGDADVQTQKVAGTSEVIIKTKTLNVDQRQALEEELVNEFGVDGSKITAESISGAVSTEMKRDAAVALAIAGVLMLLYIWARFRDIRLAASSVIALMHDVLVVVSCYALFGWSVGSTFIACVLTIVGYSINATIVIFDRIRENLAIQGKRTLEEVVNTSITETLTRSINTSLTTFVMVLALYIMGVSSIREFALPLMVGVMCGTYSSVCLSGSLWYELTVRKNKKVAEAKAQAKKAKAKK